MSVGKTVLQIVNYVDTRRKGEITLCIKSVIDQAKVQFKSINNQLPIDYRMTPNIVCRLLKFYID